MMPCQSAQITMVMSLHQGRQQWHPLGGSGQRTTTPTSTEQSAQQVCKHTRSLNSIIVLWKQLHNFCEHVWGALLPTQCRPDHHRSVGDDVAKMFAGKKHSDFAKTERDLVRRKKKIGRWAYMVVSQTKSSRKKVQLCMTRVWDDCSKLLWCCPRDDCSKLSWCCPCDDCSNDAVHATITVSFNDAVHATIAVSYNDVVHATIAVSYHDAVHATIAVSYNDAVN